MQSVIIRVSVGVCFSSANSGSHTQTSWVYKEFYIFMNLHNHYIFSMTSRVIAAVIGGYGCAVASSFALVPWLNIAFDMQKPDAVYLATMLSYLFYLGAIIWCFCQKTALLAWRDIIMSSLFFSLFYLLATPTKELVA